MLKEETWGRSFLCLGFLPEIYFCVDRSKLLFISIQGQIKKIKITLNFGWCNTNYNMKVAAGNFLH